jgi:hypothetical protein
MNVMNSCNSNSFRTYIRLHSYSSHFSAYNMPIFVFFDYPFLYQYRKLNSYELQLFRTCREGHLEHPPIIVNDIN